MIRLCAVAAICAALPVLAAGQTWQSAIHDTGSLVHGSVAAPEHSLFFHCNTPSAQGLSLMQTEDHETILNAPHGMFVSLSGRLVDPAAWGYELSAVTVTVDGTGYRLPPLRWDELYGEWLVEVSMRDAVFAGLAGASDLVLDAGTGVAWRYPTDGLAPGLQAVMAACGAGWAQPGQGTAGAQKSVDLMTPDINAYLQRECGASYRITQDAIEAHDLDRDGVPDQIVDWAGVTCNAAMARPYCGAANCSIEVFLSTRPGAPQSFIGVGYSVAQAANGALGLRFGGTAGACARGECDRVYWWDGTQFRD